MKIAKATQEDMTAALRLLGMLEDVDAGKYPRTVDGQDDESDPEDFDENDLEHLKAFHQRVMRCVRMRPSGIARVIWGFATIMDNNILDPDAKHLDLHPRLKTDDLLKAAKEGLEAMGQAQTAFASDTSADRMNAMNRLFAAVPPLYSAITIMESAEQCARVTTAGSDEYGLLKMAETLKRIQAEIQHECDLYARFWENTLLISVFFTTRDRERKRCEYGLSLSPKHLHDHQCDIRLRHFLHDLNVAIVNHYRGEAMTLQSKHYPRHWDGQVPTRVRMTRTVRPDWPGVFVLKPGDEKAACEAGREYEVGCNSHGAVFAIFPNGATLGLKPDEFQVIAWSKPEGVKREV